MKNHLFSVVRRRRTKEKKQKLFVIFQVAVVFCLLFLLPKIALAKSFNAEKLIALTNLERIKYNLPPLTIDQRLTNAATDKVNDMIINNYFDHKNPKGLEPWYWMEKENYNYKFAGENLALDFENENEIIEAWMSSKTHRENILNPDFKETGLAIREGKINSKNSTIIVQYFGQKFFNENVQIVGNVKSVKIVQDIENVKPPQLAENKNLNEQSTVLISDINVASNNKSVLSWDNTKEKETNTLAVLNAYIIPSFSALEKEYSAEIINSEKNIIKPQIILALIVLYYLFITLFLIIITKIYKSKVFKQLAKTSE